ncbi:SDR family oxidoreductase [Ancylobacter sp. A5.8]|uniref:NAD-dependent epimerase/dehydratase family protein n=1 Tax=Ancylobacter gelatini TaxID=2919920 RepID=UPI001F4D8ADF|nr:SDR family oxidoreductase [Ancylobacter gelatini]MCJ8145231.1 SDR family oxidoreductase [Ancylobacter gelatini]
MKVLVTGDTGYIGSVMVPMLVEQGFDVVGVDADLFEACLFQPAPRAARHIRAHVGDLTPRDLEGFDAVFHLAALSNDPLGDLNPNLTYELNHAATVRLASAAKQAGVERFLFSSSCSLYGASGDGAVTEEAPFAPITPYARSKAMVEWSLAAMADRNFSPVFLRNATAYGLSPRLRFDLVLNNLTAWAVAKSRVLIKSDGTPWRPIVHIEDITRAFIAAARAPRERVHNEAFNIGRDEENYQIRGLADMVEQIVPNCVIEYAPGGEPDKRSYSVSFEKVRRQLPEFQPQWTARRGVEQLYAAYREVGVTVEDFEGPRFRRIDTLKRLIAEGRLDASLRWTGHAPTLQPVGKTAAG